jgi:hypothetical protein
MIKHFSSAVVISLCLAGPSWSQDVVPDAALVEEMAGHWEQALAIYRHALAADAGRSRTLWATMCRQRAVPWLRRLESMPPTRRLARRSV